MDSMTVIADLDHARRLVEASDHADSLIEASVFQRMSGRGWLNEAKRVRAMTTEFLQIREDLGEEVTAAIWQVAVQKFLAEQQEQIDRLYTRTDPADPDNLDDADADDGTVARRQLLRWSTPHLAVLKMLAWVVAEHEHLTGDRLWARCRDLCPPVFAAVLAEEGVTLDAICAETLKAHGAPLTPSKLTQRADKTSRYQEFNEYATPVTNAYHTHRSTEAAVA